MDIGYIWNLFVAQLYLLKIREEENIYKWEPKYSVYTETQTVDGETTEVDFKLHCESLYSVSMVALMQMISTSISRLIPTFSPQLEDWFTAQGHVKKPSFWQFFNNAWLELKFGFSFYNFPWQWKLFFIGCVAWTCLAFLMLEVFKYLVRNSKHRKPVPLNSKWGNPDQYDILWYAGIRKNRSDTNDKLSLIHI